MCSKFYENAFRGKQDMVILKLVLKRMVPTERKLDDATSRGIKVFNDKNHI